VCGDQEIRRVRSPSNELAAVLYVRDCGATAREAYHLAIVDGTRDDAIGSGDIVLVVDDTTTSEREPATAAVISFTWTSPTELQVALGSRLRVFRQVPSRRGVAVKYSVSR
jgi:hypothetical protein